MAERLPKVVGFCCERHGMDSVVLAARTGKEFDASVRLVQVPCTGRVDGIHILKALDADGFLLWWNEGPFHLYVQSARERLEAQDLYELYFIAVFGDVILTFASACRYFPAHDASGRGFEGAYIILMIYLQDNQSSIIRLLMPAKSSKSQ